MMYRLHFLGMVGLFIILSLHLQFRVHADDGVVIEEGLDEDSLLTETAANRMAEGIEDAAKYHAERNKNVNLDEDALLAESAAKRMHESLRDTAAFHAARNEHVTLDEDTLLSESVAAQMGQRLEDAARPVPPISSPTSHLFHDSRFSLSSSLRKFRSKLFYMPVTATWALGSAVLSGGIMGYLNKGSIPSLVGSSVIGAGLFTATGLLAHDKDVAGHTLATVSSSKNKVCVLKKMSEV